MAYPPKPCSICFDATRSGFINPLIDAGFAPNRIEKEARLAGLTVKAETISRHRRHYQVAPAPAGLEHLPVGAVVDANDGKLLEGDFAELVAKTAQRSLADGARVTIGDGLKAQAILDKRAEKAENRRFLMNLAQLLSGGGQSAPAQLMDGEVIDAEYTDVDNPLLAPAELRE